MTWGDIMTKTQKITIFVCVVVLAMVVGSVVFNITDVLAFNNTVRPFIFMALAGLCWFAMGRAPRPRKSYMANLSALAAFVIFVCLVFAVSYMFGGGRNIMTPNMTVVLSNFWRVGLPLIFMEIARYKLLRHTGRKDKIFVFVIVTIVFALANIPDINVIVTGTANWDTFIFGSVLPAFVISFAVSFMAIDGSLAAVISISFLYNLGATFSPFLPDLQRLPWALFICAQVFVVGMLYYHLSSENTRSQRKRVARAARSSRGPVGRIFSIAVGILTITFFLGLLPLYPVVILTESMTGSINRGSLVVMRRVPLDNVEEVAVIGQVLHYHMGSLEVVHRVIGFSYTQEGVREFITQGDFNEFPDAGTLSQDDVIGIPMFIFPYIGLPNVIFRSFFGG
jgi:signal peptidase I